MTSAKTILIHFEIFAFAFDPESCSSNPMLKEFRKTLQKQNILDVATKWWTCRFMFETANPWAQYGHCINNLCGSKL